MLPSSKLTLENREPMSKLKVTHFSADDLDSVFGHSEFNIVTTPATFQDAADACSAQGARLVHTSDEASERDLRRSLDM